MTRNLDACCGNCTYWCNQWDRKPCAPKKNRPDPNKDRAGFVYTMGYCRKFSPLTGSHNFPQTDIDDWCGEHPDFEMTKDIGDSEDICREMVNGE